ncbi:MAG TPA: hypothetical protein VEX86_06510 [Longimicrobium sp.]|nr:hypothetical protein [Longimicrobium sp.]
MSGLNPESLSVTSFETSPGTGTIGEQSADCVSPLCMTEGRECTTPWCKDAEPAIG